MEILIGNFKRIDEGNLANCSETQKNKLKNKGSNDDKAFECLLDFGGCTGDEGDYCGSDCALDFGGRMSNKRLRLYLLLPIR